MTCTIDETTLWKPTGRVVYHSSSHGGHDYIQVEFKEFYRDKPGSKIVYGRPFHVDMMSAEMRAFAQILGKAQEVLASTYAKKSIPTRPLDDESYLVTWGDGDQQKCSLPYLHSKLDQNHFGWFCKSECTDRKKKFVYYINTTILCEAEKEL